MSVDDSVRVYFVTTVIWTERTDPLLVDIARPVSARNRKIYHSQLIPGKFASNYLSIWITGGQYTENKSCNVPILTECFQSTDILDGWSGGIKAGKY